MTEPLDLSSNYTGGDYVYKMGGNGQTIVDGKKQIDCSHMVNLLLTGAGYSIPYEDTRVMQNSNYYTTVSPQDARRGDIVLWINATSHQGSSPLFHTGIVEEFNPATNSGRFFGAQTSSGPASTKFGPKPPSYYWPVATKFLRPKDEFRGGVTSTPAAGPEPLMSFQYPIRKADGHQFTNVEDIYEVLEKETSGHYLLGNNRFWHGGVHITDKSAPQCVLNEPIRCMADGEVVAYRLSRDYLQSTFGEGDEAKSLKYTNSFCLVRHEYKSPRNPEEGANKDKQNTLTFFSLYMHLLPFERYPLSPEEIPNQKIKMLAGGFTARSDAKGEPGCQTYGAIAAGTEFEILDTKGTDEVYAKGKILKGRVVGRSVGQEVWFAYKKNGEVYPRTSGGASWFEVLPPQRARPNYWQGKVKATVGPRGLPLFGAPASSTDGQDAGAPSGAMALTATSVVEFDSVKVVNLNVAGRLRRMAECTLISGGLRGNGTVPPTFWACVENELPEPTMRWETVTPADLDSEKVTLTSTKIKAGDPIGYLGLMENVTGESGDVTRKHQVHVEVFTDDAKVEDFLKNVAGLKLGKQFLHLPEGTVLTKKSPQTGTVQLLKAHTVELNKAPIFKDPTEWYEPTVDEDGQSKTGLIKKTDAQILTSYDWEKLGFRIVKESSANADGFLDPDNMATFFKDLYNDLDRLGNHDGEVTPEDFPEALKNVEMRDHWSKLIAYHPTEWRDKSDAPKWSRLAQMLENSPKVLKHERARIDKLVFWSELSGKAEVPGDGMVWHFHPIEMLSNFMRRSDLIDVERFVAMYAEQHSSFQAGAPAFSPSSKSNLRKIVENINKYIDKTKQVYTIYEWSYMFATARHEAYQFTIPEYFSAAPEYGEISYFDKYDPVLANTALRRQTAIENGNTVQGDGFKYRGRGLVHLTWKKNYQKAKDYFGIDFVGSPDEAAGFENSVPIMIWGMKEGIFTGKKLGDYVNNTTKDYEGARRVINGSDQMALIASYAVKFETILKATSTAPETK